MKGLPNLQQGWLGTAPRWLRVCLIIGLCVPGAALIVVRDWFGDVSTAPHFCGRLAQLLFRVLILHPIGEHIGHLVLHRTANVQHHTHHLEIKANDAGADEFEWWCYAVAALAYANSYTRWLSLGLLQYTPTIMGLPFIFIALKAFRSGSPPFCVLPSSGSCST